MPVLTFSKAWLCLAWLNPGLLLLLSIEALSLMPSDKDFILLAFFLSFFSLFSFCPVFSFFSVALTGSKAGHAVRLGQLQRKDLAFRV